MRKRLLDLDAMVDALKPFLPQYLQEFGIDTNKNFMCINPDHADTNASMTLKQDNENAWCFGCSTTCGIFQAAHFLEKKPLKGTGWVQDNLLYLAKKFGVKEIAQDLTQEELYEYRTYQAYKFVSEIISDPAISDYTLVDEEIKRRGWSKDKLADWGIGTIDIKTMLEMLNNAGYEKKGFLDSIDLDRGSLFREDHLIFTVYDDYHRPVGFSARNLKFNKSNPNSRKFNSSRTTGLECNIFKKSERLYGFEIAKSAGDPLYIFEGPADVISARHYGLMNCCSTLGVNLSDHHIHLLKKYGCFNIVLVFDGDEAGQVATIKTLDEKFGKYKDFRVQMIQLPDGMDPDEIFREKGLDGFLSLKKWSAFEWRLAKLLENYDGDSEEQRSKVAETMAPIIASEISIIRQEEKCKQVARMTGYEFSTIMSEVKRLRNVADAKMQERKVGAIEALVDRVRWNPDEVESALDETRVLIDTINKESEEKGDSRFSLDTILNQKERDEKKTGEFEGFVLRPEGLGGIGSRLNGDWRSGCLMYIAGSEQSMKSSLASQLAYEITTEPANNAIVIYNSIDDAARFILYKFVCQAVNDDLNNLLEINHISSPNYWSKVVDTPVVQLREKGYKAIINLVKDNRLILKDTSDGNTLAYFESILKGFREKFPDKNIIMIIDSFHKIFEMENSRSGQEKIRAISNRLKSFTTNYAATVIATAEYRKMQPGENPDNAALNGSAALQYDANVILHLFNDVHVNGEEEAVCLHKMGQKILPRIRCKFGKNKISGYEDRDFLNAYPASAILRAVDKESAIQEMIARQKLIRENGSERSR